MIVISRRARQPKLPACGAEFERLLPRIRQQARIAFQGIPAEAREEMIAETVANAFVAFARLVERGKVQLAYPTPLAQFAIRQVRSGRRVGARSNVCDVGSRRNQLVKNVVVERLDHFYSENNEWREVLVEDRHAGPAETAAVRIDFEVWFRSLTPKKQRIARTLARGEATGAAAKKFNLTPGRLSQLRREFKQSWDTFQGATI